MLDNGSSGQAVTSVKDTLSRPFRPGQFFQDITNAGVKFGISRDEVINKVAAAATQHFAGT